MASTPSDVSLAEAEATAAAATASRKQAELEVLTAEQVLACSNDDKVAACSGEIMTSDDQCHVVQQSFMRQLLTDEDIPLIEEARATAQLGAPPRVTVAVLEYAYAILETIAGKSCSSSITWASVQRTFGRDDLILRMRWNDVESRRASSDAVKALKPVFDNRLQSAGVTQDRAAFASAGTGAVFRWCQAALAAAEDAGAPNIQEADQSEDVRTSADLAIQDAEAKVALARDHLRLSVELESHALEKAQCIRDELEELRRVPDLPQGARISRQESVREVAPKCLSPQILEPVASAVLDAEPAEDSEDDSTVCAELEQPFVVLKQCIQFRRGNHEITDDQLNVLKSATAALLHHDVSAAVVGFQEEYEEDVLGFKRAESVRGALAKGGAMPSKVHCVAGGPQPRGNRKAELRVLQRLSLPEPIVFDEGSSALPSAARASVRCAARTLSQRPALQVYLLGSKNECEDSGLGKARAEEVRNALSKRGIEAARLHCSESEVTGTGVELQGIELPGTAFVAAALSSS